MPAKKEVKKETVSSFGPALVGVRVTEKSTTLAEGNIYTFNVAKGTTKNEIIKEIKTRYKVTPVKVSVVTIKPRRVVVRGRLGVKPAGKKAMVFLKKGETIAV